VLLIRLTLIFDFIDFYQLISMDPAFKTLVRRSSW